MEFSRFRIYLNRIKDGVPGAVRRHFFERKRIVLFAVVAFLLVVNAVLGAWMNSIVAGLPEFLLADRWSSEDEMAQVSMYTTEDQMVDVDSIKRFEYMLEKKLGDEGALDPDEYKDSEKPKVFAVGYCAQGQVSLTFENRTAENASAIGVGGNFFLFHPMEYVAGGPFSGDYLMQDSIVIDEEMAWQLFGSTDIIGQMVTIGGVPHYVVGVVARDTGKLKKAAGLDKSYVYLSYDSLSRYGRILSGVTSTEDISEDGTTALRGGINCIEVVCPNPVKGLSAKISRESLGIPEEFVTVIDNTDRFSFFSLVKVIRSYGTRSMWSKAIYYPYWENIARGYEDVLATILAVRILCMLAVVVIVAISIINAYRHKTWTVRSVAKYLADKKYDWEAEHKRLKEERSTL